ncbi:hypothetical protein PILCRDRAFT_698083 [Piloderma croceum F 1598]|uniref:SET domain-containing protein n=1 Tax=Piloderma croceum (strain F 1598) TaxID=765440 RepID=A0A0C3EQ26_PILCF|nr:hypothetical protein PILCRDRAFT_698083 [Piloderma croceum F 1598]
MAKSISATSRPDGSYEMVSNAPILPHSEIFNTYGEKLTNAQLLVRYGFALDSNENDCITWDWGDLWTFAAAILDDEPRDTSESSGRPDDVMQLYSQAINLWPSESRAWDETGFVFNPETATNAIIKGGGRGGSPQRRSDQAADADAVVLCLNGDGRISHHLWLYCAVLGHQRVMCAIDGGVEEIVGQLREIAALLMQIEKEMALEGSSSDDSDRNYGAARQRGGEWRQLICYPPTPILEVASQTVRTVLCLCRSRSKRIGKGDLWNAFEIGEELDRVPPHMTRTRRAMVEALSEKSLLESVESMWSHMAQRLNCVTLEQTDQNFNKSQAVNREEEAGTRHLAGGDITR